MNDDFEHRVQEWMAEASPSTRDVERLLATDLPARRSLWRSFAAVGTAAATAVLVLGVGVGLIGRPSFGVGAAATQDPRAARCGVSAAGDAVTAFAVSHAADYHRYLPAMLLAPELDRPDPALIVVLSDVPLGLGRNDTTGHTDPAVKVAGKGTVCIVVGTDPASADVNVYENVDLSGINDGR